jgi:hypothetical protein
MSYQLEFSEQAVKDIDFQKKIWKQIFTQKTLTTFGGIN